MGSEWYSFYGDLCNFCYSVKYFVVMVENLVKKYNIMCDECDGKFCFYFKCVLINFVLCNVVFVFMF